MMSSVEETLQMIPVIKSFNMEFRKQTEFHEENQKYSEYTLRYQQRQNLLQPITTFIGGLGVITFVWFLSSDIRDQSISIAEIVSIIMYGTMLIRPLSSLSAVYGQFQNTQAASSRIQGLLNNEREVSTNSTENIGHEDSGLSLIHI